jgi:hypothetical protein
MQAVRLRAFALLEYGDPTGFLAKLREIEPRVAKSELPLKERTLRTHELRPWRELREAALFCHFVGERIGIPVQVAGSESQDYDAVATWEDAGARKYAPIQIKEVVPAYLNPNTDLASVIDSLSKYVDSSDLTVAIHLNKQVTFVPEELVVPPLPIRALWVFGSTSSDATRWNLWGNLLDAPVITEHVYPAA